MHLSYFSTSEIKGTIEVHAPIRALGDIIDVHNNKWNIRALIEDYVLACPLNDLHPYFTDTSNTQYPFVSQEWGPYLVKQIPPDCNRVKY